jgi:hypothetical protein
VRQNGVAKKERDEWLKMREMARQVRENGKAKNERDGWLNKRETGG